MMDTLRVGARLKAARKAAGFKTSKEFIRKYHIPASTYSQHESGSRSPDSEALKFYSKSFGVSFDWLNTGKGLPYKNIQPAQRSAMTEELIDLKILSNPVSTIDTKLLEDSLKKAINKHSITIPAATIKKIIQETIKLYKKS